MAAPRGLNEVGQLVVDAASQCGVPSARAKPKHTPEIEELFKARRCETDPLLRKLLSRDLWKALRKQRRQRRDNEVAEVAERGQGLRNLLQVRQRHSGVGRASEVVDKNGSVISDSAGIAEIFADFYQDLYSLSPHEGEHLEDELR